MLSFMQKRVSPPRRGRLRWRGGGLLTMRVMVLVMRCLMCTDCYLSWHGKDSNRKELLRFWV
jgi:hypothetical protein